MPIKIRTNVDESRGDQDTSTEVLAEEEHLRWNLHPFDLLSNDRKATATDGCEEHNDCCRVS